MMANLKDRYDAIVIGAGIGGLTCGALLAKDGLNVLVTEQHSKPGGYCTSFRRKGFTFDAGFDTTFECEKGGIIYDTLDELGLTGDIQFIRLAAPMRVVGDDYDVLVTTVDELTGELKRVFPGENTGIGNFMGDCQALASEMKSLAAVPPDLLGLTGKLGLIMKFLLKSPRMRKYSGKSCQEVLNAFFRDPRLKAFYGTIVPFGPKAMAPLLMMILGGEPLTYYPRGGAQALADTFAKGVTRHGGELALNTMVARILIEGGAAAGVELADGNRLRSRFVVSNADGRETFLKLIGEQHLAPKLVREIKETGLSEPYLLVSLGVDLDLGAMGFDGTSIIYNRCDDLDKIFSPELDHCYLSIKMHSLRDASQAPENMATVQMSTSLPYDYMGNWKREKDGTCGGQYTQLKESVADKLIVSAERFIPGLSDHIVVKDIATPLTFERYTLNCQGANMGWFPAPGGKIRSQKTPIRNLYQAGAWTYPGPSLYAVVPSGRNAAQLVLQEA
jgi:phytoene dehydrogenase-like protein